MKNKNEQNKQGCLILLSLLIMILLIFIFNWLLKTLVLKEYSPYYFACVKLPFPSFYIIFPFAFLFVFTFCFYFYSERKVSNRKYITITSVFLSATLIVTVIFSCNIWNFSRDTISYNTLFHKDKIVYSFDDIKVAEMQIESEATRFTSTRLVYTLEMNDGKQIKFDAYDSFRKNDKMLIEFDKAIADKRKIISEFKHFENSSNEFNNYYRSLFPQYTQDAS